MAQERLVLDPTEPARTNLIDNPSFETNTTNWVISAPSWTEGTLTREALPFSGSSGAYVGRVKAKKDATATQRFLTVYFLPAESTKLVTPGAVYSYRLLANVIDAVGEGFIAYVAWYNGAEFISAAGSTAIQSGTGIKTLEGNGLVAPAKTTRAMVIVEAKSSTSSDTADIRLDSLILEESATIRAYFDGDTQPSPATYDVAWTGTPHASTSTIAPKRTELDITPWIKVDGIDWGEASMEPYRAKAKVGESVIDYDLPNRLISAPMVIRDMGGTTFAQVRSNIQSKAALCIREGMIGKRITAQGGTVYFDIVANGLTLGGDWLQANRGVDTNAELRLESIPDFYEPEELVAEAEEKTATELIKVIPDPGGDMPARVRIEVTDKQGESIKGVIWAFRSRYYSSATTAKTAYEAEEMEPLGSSSKGALSGASNGTAVSNTALPSVFTPILNTGYLTHTGTNRVFARLRSPDGTAVSGQFSWDVGDLVNPTVNDSFTMPGGSAFYVVDAGEVRLDPPPVGTHRWQGRFDFKGTTGGEDAQIDKVWIVNTDEGMGILSSPPQASVGELKAWDNFNTHTAGTLTGKVLSLGGTWTGAGDAVGFTIDATNHWVYREEKSDASTLLGYWARAGTATAQVITVKADVSAYVAGNGAGIFARYTNTSNALVVFWAPWIGPGEWYVSLFKIVAGVVSSVAASSPITGISDGAWQSLVLTVDKAGAARVYRAPQGGVPTLVIAASDSVLATGGALESGGFGLYDSNLGGVTTPRRYDNFFAESESSTSDAVIFASQEAQLTTDGMYRLDSGGSAYGPVSRVIGDLPRLPAGGLEGRSVELFVKNSAGDFDELADSSIPDLAVKVYASRSWLTVPGTI